MGVYYQSTDNVQMNRVMLGYKETVAAHPNITFASFCRAIDADYARVKLWLYRYKGLTVFELKTGITTGTGNSTMKGRDKHRDVVNVPITPELPSEPLLKEKPLVLKRDRAKKMIGEITFEIPDKGIKTTLKNVPVTSFNQILTTITKKYGKDMEIETK